MMETKLTWDYKGCGENSPNQNSWNDTLVTKLNQSASIIHTNTLRHTADTIMVNPCLKSFLSTLTFYRSSNDGDSIGGRFNVIYSTDVNERQLVVKYDHTKDIHNDFCVIPEVSGNFVNIKLVNINEEADKYNNYVKGLSVIIDIENLSDDDLYGLNNQ